ncbi:MAG: hypothetical protein EDR02_17705 [Actinobacteria bacterium]|nr:MAG: hypothetical protein EDR02_17705 [Actinomycetota bacterium]RIK04096.1 MAG: hypothetical protein DCC48_14350 [Acidobacteriota bacterium]
MASDNGSENMTRRKHGSEPADVHDWISFEDSDGDTWLFDVTFMLSNWTCIYGNGCPGVLDGPAPGLEQGCCSYGAHFADKEDRQRVRRAAKRLDNKQWQHRAAARELGGPIFKNDDGEWVARLVDDACIFLNRPGFPGGAGCALHRGADEADEPPLEWKPDVCWQLPLRLTEETDENGHVTFTVREWKRYDWGDGGSEFHWWCTDSDLAFVGRRPVYRALKDELVALVGEEPYRLLANHLRHREEVHFLPHPRGARTT